MVTFEKTRLRDQWSGLSLKQRNSFDFVVSIGPYRRTFWEALVKKGTSRHIMLLKKSR
jgi:hypothetical protein